MYVPKIVIAVIFLFNFDFLQVLQGFLGLSLKTSFAYIVSKIIIFLKKIVLFFLW
jgi:hypothetical protein